MPYPILQSRIKDLVYIHLALLPYYVAEMLSQGGMGQPYLNLVFEFCRCGINQFSTNGIYRFGLTAGLGTYLLCTEGILGTPFGCILCWYSHSAVKICRVVIPVK